MWFLIVFLVLAICILSAIIYEKNQIIEERTATITMVRKRSCTEIIDLMDDLKRKLNTYTEPATRDTQIRRFIEETKTRYRQTYRRYENGLSTNPNKTNA